MSSKTSTGINFLGIPTVVMYMQEILKIYPEHKNNIISIGSGGGYIEKVLDSLLNINIICVDPNPLSYIPDKTIYKNPDYETINSKEFPTYNFINNCILFINWSEPEQCNGYDIQSIIRLNPICILTITETGIYRGSGSIGFHHFLSENHIITQGIYQRGLDECREPDKLDFSDFSYIDSAKTTCYYTKPSYTEQLKFEIILLTKNRISVSLPSILYPYNSPQMKDYSRFNWISIKNRIDNLTVLSVENELNQKEHEEKTDNSWEEHINNIISVTTKRHKKKKKNKK